jgi:excisionase family DNA binding protein
VENRLLLRVDEAADLLNIGRSAVYDLVRLGVLRSVKIGRCRRIPVVVLREYVERLTKEGGDAA